jgi:Protein of unknown function (DUF2510)
MSIPDPTQPAAPSGWYPTGETGPDGLPVERWWDGAAWSAMVRPLGGGTGTATGGGRRRSTARSLIAAGIVVVLVGGGLGAYFALRGNSTSSTASTSTQPTSAPNGNGGLGGGGTNGGTGGGTGGGGLGSGGTGGGSSASPAPTVTGGSGQTVSDPIDELTIPVPSGWTGTSGSASGEGSWPSLSTGPYTCPTALAQSNGTSSAAAQCTRGGVSFTTTTAASGATVQSTATSTITSLASDNYGKLTSHKVVSQGALTVAGRTGYQITWSVVPDYTGPGGTVEDIVLPVPGESTYFTVIDIGVDNSSQAPSLSSVNSAIIQGITDSNAAGA